MRCKHVPIESTTNLRDHKWRELQYYLSTSTIQTVESRVYHAYSTHVVMIKLLYPRRSSGIRITPIYSPGIHLTIRLTAIHVCIITYCRSALLEWLTRFFASSGDNSSLRVVGCKVHASCRILLPEAYKYVNRRAAAVFPD